MIKIINASATNIPLRDKSVHCIVTSPPYFGLRNYTGNQNVDWPAGVYSPCTGAPVCIEVPAMRCGFGSESTVEDYIFHSLLVLRECWRVLRDDGVMWWNLGDSYNGSGKGGVFSDASVKQATNIGANIDKPLHVDSLKHGNLIGIPARFMLAAQADGWIVRNDCVWHKKAPMPESVSGTRWVKHKIKVESRGQNLNHRSSVASKKHNPSPPHPDNGIKRDETKYIDCPGCDECRPNDGLVLKRGSWRHTRAHEFVFQLTKQMSYWADGDAVKERANYPGDNRKARSNGTHKTMPTELQNGIRPGESNYDLSGRNPRSALSVDAEQEIAAMVAGYEFELRSIIAENRNPRSVLSPAPSNYRGAHFATFSPELIRNLIKSSTPKKCCAECGAGYAPVIKHKSASPGRSNNSLAHKEQMRMDGDRCGGFVDHRSDVIGYRQICTCNVVAPIPGVCFDPFVGSGTTLQVCRELGLSGIGLDVSLPYLHEQATRRAEKRTPQVIIDKHVNELPLFAESQTNHFTRIVLDGRNGKGELKTEEVIL